MKRKKELNKIIEYFFISMKENFVEGKELDGVLKIALGSSLWLSHRISVFPVGQIWEYWLILIQCESDSSEAQFPPLGICSFCCHKDCLGALKNRTTRDGPFQEQCIIATRKTQEFFWTSRASFSFSFQMVLDKTTLNSMALFFSWLDMGAPLSFCHMKAPRKNSIFVYAFLSFGYG